MSLVMFVTIRFASSSRERLDPGRETTEAMDVDRPVVALEAAHLKEMNAGREPGSRPVRTTRS